ncbi:MAG: ral secretion pathway protein [Rhizorhabdus sp.]|nr:ral secretion pathway protein [Rhizorhabdus sp.]
MTRYASTALILLALAPVARFGQIAFDRWRFESEARRIAQSAMGNESVGADPRTALQRRLVELRGPGMGFSAGTAIMVDAVAHTPNVALAGFSFDRNGVIVADVTSASPIDLAQLIERIEQGGLVVEAMPGAARGISVLRLRRP